MSADNEEFELAVEDTTEDPPTAGGSGTAAGSSGATSAGAVVGAAAGTRSRSRASVTLPVRKVTAGPSAAKKKAKCSELQAQIQEAADRAEAVVDGLGHFLARSDLELGEVEVELSELQGLEDELQSLPTSKLPPKARAQSNSLLMLRGAAILSMKAALEARRVAMEKAARESAAVVTAAEAAAVSAAASASGANSTTSAGKKKKKGRKDSTSVIRLLKGTNVPATGVLDATSSARPFPSGGGFTTKAAATADQTEMQKRLALMALGGGAAGPPAEEGAEKVKRWLGGRHTNSELVQPSWATGGNQAFNPNECSQGDDWYRDFPHPWNAIPQNHTATAGEVLRVAAHALPKFSGNPSTYEAWRSSFIPCVHLAAIHISFKAVLLKACMVPNGARMREFVENIACNADGYKEAIGTLERRYGGEEAVLLAKQDSLMRVPEVKEGDFTNIELLHGRLRSFLTQWRSIIGGPMKSAESLAFFTMVMNKLEVSFSLKYLEWLSMFQRQKGLHTLQEWLGNQLDNHRTALRYGRRKELLQRARAASTGDGDKKKRFGQDRLFFGEEEEAPSGEEDEWEEDWGTQVLVGRQRPPQLGCPLCKADHRLGRCEKFQKELTPTERRDFLAGERRCFLCFQKGHGSGKCKLSFSCKKMRPQAPYPPPWSGMGK